MSVQRRIPSSPSGSREAGGQPAEMDHRPGQPTEKDRGPEPYDYFIAAGDEDPDEVVDEWEQALRGEDEPEWNEQPQRRPAYDPPRDSVERPASGPAAYGVSAGSTYGREPYGANEHSSGREAEQPTQVFDTAHEANGWEQRSYPEHRDPRPAADADSLYSGSRYLESPYGQSDSQPHYTQPQAKPFNGARVAVGRSVPRDESGDASGYLDHPQAGYPEADPDQAGYDQPGYDRARYDRAGYDEADDGQARYDQAGYDQADYDRVDYERANDGQARYDQADFDRAAYGQVDENRAGYGQVDEDRAGYGRVDDDRADPERADEDRAEYDRAGYGGQAAGYRPEAEKGEWSGYAGPGKDEPLGGTEEETRRGEGPGAEYRRPDVVEPGYGPDHGHTPSVSPGHSGGRVADDMSGPAPNFAPPTAARPAQREDHRAIGGAAPREEVKRPGEFEPTSLVGRDAGGMNRGARGVPPSSAQAATFSDEQAETAVIPRISDEQAPPGGFDRASQLSQPGSSGRVPPGVERTTERPGDGKEATGHVERGEPRAPAEGQSHVQRGETQALAEAQPRVQREETLASAEAQLRAQRGREAELDDTVEWSPQRDDEELGDTAEWSVEQDWDEDQDGGSRPDTTPGQREFSDRNALRQPDRHADPNHQPTPDESEDSVDGEARTELIPRVAEEATPEAGAPAAAEAEAPAPAPQPAAPKRRRPVALVVTLLLITLAGAGAAYYSWTKLQEADRVWASSNRAFIDQAATAEVRDQVSRAIEAIYSYDSTRLDESESRALSVITDPYTEEFKRNFAMVRQLGPQKKATLTSTVAEAGVLTLSDQRATLLVMINQVGHRSDAPQPLKASVRLNVTAERVGGQWKVSGIEQL